MKRHFKELIERHFKGLRKIPFIDDNEKNGTSIWMVFELQADVTRSLPV